MNLKPGDKVKIKSWEAMEKEFGLNSYGDINCLVPFFANMEKDLPKDRTVTVEKVDEDIFTWKGWGNIDKVIET